MDDPFDLARFVEAQEGSYASARQELRSGRKLRHWMWFMFPQVDGLGSSRTARQYAIRSKGEARAYIAHPLLGTRLVELTALVVGHAGINIEAIFGHVDALKFRSSMTLFHGIAPEQSLFQNAIDQFYDAEPDPHTLQWLQRER